MSNSSSISYDVAPSPSGVAAVGAQMPCWCGQGAWRLCFRTPKFGVLECSSCGTFRIDPPPLQGDDQSGDFYTDYYSKVAVAHEPAGSANTRSAWFWRVADRHPELAKPGLNVADIGSGDGHFCAELRAAGWQHVVGVEISKTRVARARQLYPDIPFFSCGLPETSTPEGSLDLMVMDSVIEHLPHPVEIVRDLWKYLKPGGVLVMLTPNMESGHFRFLGKRWTGMLAPHAHIFLFTQSSLSLLLARAGFHVDASGGLHMPVYKPSEYVRRFLSGDLKGTAWRAHQEIGGLYGRLLGSGPMLYVVASKPRSAT